MEGLGFILAAGVYSFGVAADWICAAAISEA